MKDEVVEDVEFLDASLANNHSSSTISSSTTSLATLNGTDPSIFSASVLSKDILETSSCSKSLLNISHSHRALQEQCVVEQDNHNITSELAETNVYERDYAIDQLGGSDNTATNYCGHTDDGRAKESQTAQNEDIATQGNCSLLDMEIHNVFPGHQNEQAGASTTEDASKEQMQDRHRDQGRLKRDNCNMDPENSQAGKKKKFSEGLGTDSAKILDSRDGDLAISQGGITGRRPTRSCVANRTSILKATKRTSGKKSAPTDKLTWHEYDMIRRWREDDRIKWSGIFKLCEEKFPGWQQTSIKSSYRTIRYMKHPFKSILAKKLDNYLILWAEDNSMTWEPEKNIPRLQIKNFEKDYQGFDEGVSVQDSRMTEDGIIEYFMYWSYGDKKMEGGWEKEEDLSPNLLNRISVHGFET